jgi:hypothetical protein
MEKGAGGNGLNGFAQPHFVGQEGPLAKGKVEHAFALVGKERGKGDVLGMATLVHASLIVAPQQDAFFGAPAGFQPRSDFLRGANGRTAKGFQLPDEVLGIGVR